MKLTKNILLLILGIALTGCVSTEPAATGQDGETKDQLEGAIGGNQEEMQPGKKNKTLIDSYISGEVPGYRD